MITILKWNRNFKNFEISKFLKSISKEIENDHYEDLQTEQLSKGRDKKDNLVGTYSKYTEIISKKNPRPTKIKKAGNPYNLQWSGDFFKKTSLKISNNNTDLFFTLDSSSKNTNKLFKTIKKYGLIENPESTLFGFQDNNKSKFVKAIEKIYYNKIINKLS